MTLGIKCDRCHAEDMGGGGWFKFGDAKICYECRMEQIKEDDEARAKSEEEAAEMLKDALDLGLPASCDNGKWRHCFECLFYAGVLKVECPKNGGTGEYEPSLGARGRADTFAEYDLEHGPKHRVSDDDPNKIPCFDTGGGKLEWGRDKRGNRIPDLDKIHISSKGQEREYYKRMQIRSVERGDEVLGIDAPLKDRPKGKLYSFIKK